MIAKANHDVFCKIHRQITHRKAQTGSSQMTFKMHSNKLLVKTENSPSCPHSKSEIV